MDWDGFRDLLRPPRVGEVLVSENVLTIQQLNAALSRQKGTTMPLGELVVDLGYASEKAVLSAIGKRYGITPESLNEDIHRLITDRLSKSRAFLRASSLRHAWPYILLGLVIWLALWAGGFFLLENHQDRLNTEVRSKGLLALDLLAGDAQRVIATGDPNALSRRFQLISGQGSLLYGMLTDGSRVIIAHSDAKRMGQKAPQSQPSNANAAIRIDSKTGSGKVSSFYYTHPGLGKVMHLSMPIANGAGELQVGLSLESVLEAAYFQKLVLILGGGGLMLLGVMLMMAVGIKRFLPYASPRRRMSGPNVIIPSLANPGKDVIIPPEASEAYLEALGKNLGKYMAPEIVERLLSNSGHEMAKGTRCEASVLFTDVRDYTALSGTREPEEVVEALNEYFTVVGHAIIQYGGYVDKYMGDAVLGVFGIPGPENHAEQAVRAAVAMQRQLKRSSSGNLNPMLLRVGVGLNSGTVVFGNIGSDLRMEYTVIGDPVNIAARLNGVAKSGEIIISDSTYQQLPKHLVTAKKMPPQKVKGKDEPLVAHRVLKTAI